MSCPTRTAAPHPTNRRPVYSSILPRSPRQLAQEAGGLLWRLGTSLAGCRTGRGREAAWACRRGPAVRRRRSRSGPTLRCQGFSFCSFELWGAGSCLGSCHWISPLPLWARPAPPRPMGSPGITAHPLSSKHCRQTARGPPWQALSCVCLAPPPAPHVPLHTERRHTTVGLSLSDNTPATCDLLLFVGPHLPPILPTITAPTELCVTGYACD